MKNHVHYAWVMVILSAVIFAVMAARFYTFGVFLLPLSEEFHWSRGSISLAISAASIVGGLLSIFIAQLSDRYGPRLVVTIAGTLHTIGFLLATRITRLWHLYLIWGFIMGIGSACGYVPLMSTIARWFEARRTTAIGITIAGFALGAISWPPLTQWFISTLDWRRAFLILGIVSGLVMIPLAQLLKSTPESIKLKPFGYSPSSPLNINWSDNPGLSLNQAVKTGRFWLWGPITFCFFTSLNILYVHIVAHARDIGIPPIIAASTLSIIAGSSILARLTIGAISDKVGTRTALSGALALSVIAFSFLVFSPWHWTFYLFLVVFGLSYGSVVPLETAVPAGLFGTASLGAIMAAVGLFPMIGGAAGPPVAGTIFDRTGAYQPTFIICLGLSLAALVLSILLSRFKEKEGAV
ncbi:MAG: MFS transporter [Deltaproteobacteria bacterium]|nr:MFS transporter [Deltaproteobacteria bacterium]